jgi:acyl-CoA synthetase (AMP-forming)/AMP-acid ligase II
MRVNVADRLAAIALQMPDAMAIACASRRNYATCTFRDLDDDAAALARGLVDIGVTPGMRIVLMVRPGVEFVKLVFALLRSGATTVLIDPGMGRTHLINCLAAAEPDGFVAISAVQAARVVYRRRFPRAKLNVTVGHRWFWGGAIYSQLLKRGRNSHAFLPTPQADDAAAIIFTSGSTGPPKGVLYTHEMFDTQATEIQRAYHLQPGGVDLACFALFGLFNSAMGVTTVFPEMDFSRPASADSERLLAAANEWKVTQAFASPAVWDNLSRHCERTGERIPTLRKAFSCGAPVPATVLKRTLAMVHPEAEMHTPYGATEALPVATIEAREVLGETAAKTSAGAGVCVGRRFASIEWRVLRISDEPIEAMEDAEELGVGEIGELVVRGAQVSPAYMGTTVWTGRLSDQSESRETGHSVDANRGAKIRDGDTVWHRMGDVGYLDDQARFWYCGRRGQRVESAASVLFTECVEAVFNQHPAVRRCALVGDGGHGFAAPVIVVEVEHPELAGGTTGKLADDQLAAWEQLVAELIELGAGHSHTADIGQFLLHPSLPVDVRHNAKINREQLAVWATNVIADHKLRPHPTKRHVLSVNSRASRD